MIIVLFSRPEFEYDVHSLVKAFFPKEEVQMYYTCSRNEVSEQNLACAHHEADDSLDQLMDEASAVLSVNYHGLTQSLMHYTCLGEQQEHCIELSLQSREPLRLESELFMVDYEDRLDVKNQLKQKLYDLLAKSTGRELPWGTLTGIRPTKIPMKMLEDGMEVADIRKQMK